MIGPGSRGGSRLTLVATCLLLVLFVISETTVAVAAGGDVAKIAKGKHHKKKKKKKHPPPPPPPPPTAPPPPPPPPPPNNPPSGQVVYTARNCFKDTVTGQTPPGVEMPLDGATVRLIPASGPAINASLDQNGNFNASLNPAQTYTAFAVLDSAKISVGPDTTASAPYQIPLGPVTQSAQRFVIGGGTGSTVTDPASGAANIFSTLQKGARVGSQAPVPIPKVNARWRYASDLTSWLGDRTPSQYDGTNQIYIGGQQAGAFRDEYERYPLLHEYAHHIL